MNKNKKKSNNNNYKKHNIMSHVFCVSIVLIVVNSRRFFQYLLHNTLIFGFTPF